MERENGPTGGSRFQQVRKSGLNAGRLVAEGQGADRRGESRGDSLAVLLGLILEPNERGALFLGLDGSGGLTIHKEEVIRLAEPLPERELTHRNAARGVDVGVLAVLNDPARLLEQSIDGLPGFLFWRQGRLSGFGPQFMTPVPVFLQESGGPNGAEFAVTSVLGRLLWSGSNSASKCREFGMVLVYEFFMRKRSDPIRAECVQAGSLRIGYY